MRDRSALISKLLNNRQARENYIRSKLNILVPSQLRGLRLKYPMTQKELGEAADMKQSRISAMERPGETQFNIETLIRLAAALKVGVMVKFVSFGEMLRWENQYSQDKFHVIQIDDDAEFITPATGGVEYDIAAAAFPGAAAAAGNLMPRGPVIETAAAGNLVPSTRSPIPVIEIASRQMPGAVMAREGEMSETLIRQVS